MATMTKLPNYEGGDELAQTTEAPGGEPEASTAKPAETGEAKSGEVAVAKAEAPAAPEPRKKQRRGFAAMDRSLVRAIASKGGVAAHEKGTAHKFTREEAREAGKKGGRAPHRVRGRKLPEENGASVPPV